MKGETDASGVETKPMHVYLLRHGIAEDDRPGLTDADRALTPEGKRRLRHVLKAVAESGLKPPLILSSPLKRALQTAELAKEILKCEGDVLRTRALTPGSSPEQAWEEIRAHRDQEALLLVGHNPLYDSLAPFLLGAMSLQVDFKKGAILRVDIDSFPSQPRGVLRWYLTAKLSATRD
jgi:phosphohistidine phosphatase